MGMMTKSELIEKLEDIEWEDFEVKEAKSEIPKSSWETVSAFSNTAGGWMIFGVSKKRIEVKSKKYNFKDKAVLSFYIPQKSSGEKPIYFNSPKNTFIWTGSGDQRATQEEIDSFFRAASFEEKSRELTSLELKDLDVKTIEQFRNFFASKNPTHRYLELSVKGYLDKEIQLVAGYLLQKEEINMIIKAVFRCLRKRIETVFSQLYNQFMIQRNYAKSFLGVAIRIISKIVASIAAQCAKKFFNNKSINNVKYVF